MPTQIEKSIIQGRRTQGILRPLLEELFKQSIRVENQADIDFINYAASKSAEREKERGQNSVFSPSGLSDCMRRVYLGRHWKELGLERIVLPNVQTHGTFSNGDWVHLQWHFYLHKLDQLMGDKFILIDIEIPVMSKRKDHGGTVDAIGYLVDLELPVAIDYKGWNVRNFQAALKGAPHSARIQLTDYMMLLNAGSWKWPVPVVEAIEAAGFKVPRRIKDGLILAVNKGGPDYAHPLALHEIHVSLDDNLPDVRARLGALREHESKKEIPQPECTSTKTVQYLGCPFAGYCKGEIKQIEKKLQNEEGNEFRVARPTRRRKK